jgi:hypothetical protein
MTHGKGREFKKLPPITPDNVKDGQCVQGAECLLD